MLTIGLIGGLSWTSTVEYYRIINRTVSDRLGGHNSAKLILYSVNFSEHLAIHEGGGWEMVAREMIEIAERLKTGGADFILLGANTAHKVADEVETKVGIPVLHIADATAEAIKAKGFPTVGLLGTRHTMNEDFYRRRLQERHGLKVVVPAAEDAKTIDAIIFDELVDGRIEEDSRRACLEIIDRLAGSGCEAIVLACTELPLLIKQEHTPIPVFDTLTIHAQAAVARALGE
jgi:aspartate racemase